MADSDELRPTPGQIAISRTSSERTPFIYFDGVSAFGQNNGAIQIELAATVIMPDGGKTRTDVLQTAHLRCSPAAAISLREAIDKALAFLQQGQEQAEAGPPLKH